MTDLKYCRVEDEGRLRIVTLNRPEVMNALHSEAHFELEKVLVTSVQQSGGGSGVPMESVSMSYKVVKFKHQPQSETGVLDAEAVYGIDLETYTESV